MTNIRLDLFTANDNDLPILRTRRAVRVRNLSFEIMQLFEDNVLRFCATFKLQLLSLTLVWNRLSCFCAWSSYGKYQHLSKRVDGILPVLLTEPVVCIHLFPDCTVSCCFCKKTANPTKEFENLIHLEYNTLVSWVPDILIVKIEFQLKTSGV
jgi:hypothetical protein